MDFHIPIQLSSKQQHKDLVAMVDSGAITKFLYRCFVKQNHVLTRKLKQPIPLYNIDGTENHNGTITKVAILDMTVDEHQEQVVFVVSE